MKITKKETKYDKFIVFLNEKGYKFAYKNPNFRAGEGYTGHPYYDLMIKEITREFEDELRKEKMEIIDINNYRKISAEKLSINVEQTWTGSECWLKIVEERPDGIIHHWQPDIDYEQMWMIMEYMKNNHDKFYASMEMIFDDWYFRDKDIRLVIAEAFMKYEYNEIIFS
jgi:hypothetical protein